MKRRDFIKISGAAALAAACGPKGTQAQPAQEEGPEQMLMRQNPKNGDRISALGFGCMRWPMIKDANGKDVIDQEAVNEMVDYAIAHGINYFDTSPAYLQGQSEKAAGIALSRYPRDKYYIATKLSNFSDASPEASIQMYKDSFKQLKTDYFDYYLLHSIGRGGKDAFNKRYVDNGLLPFLLEEKRAGRIRNLGFSFHGAKHEFDYFMELFDSGEMIWDFVQIEMNYVDWTHADGVRNVNADYLYEQLDKRGLPIVIMEPLLGGRLANVPDPIVRKMKKRKPDSSVASWAFRYAGTPKGVLTALSGMTYMEHLRDNINTFAPLEPITEEENAFLMEIAEDIYNLKTIPCNECNYCMPCPYGINIPAILSHYNKCIKEGNLPNIEKEEKDTEDQKEFRRQRRAFLIGYDRSVPRLRQASHCIQCGQCSPHCPQRIDIPREMRRIDEFVETLKRDGFTVPAEQ